MDSGVWHQVGLELGNIDVECTIESQRGGQRGDNLGNESVQIGVGWSLNIHVTTANVIDGFIVNHKGTVRVLQCGVSGQDRVVRLDNRCRDLRYDKLGLRRLKCMMIDFSEFFEFTAYISHKYPYTCGAG